MLIFRTLLIFAAFSISSLDARIRKSIFRVPRELRSRPTGAGRANRQDSGAASQGWGATSQDWGAASQDWGAASQDWGAASQDWGAASQGWGAASQDWGATSQDWGAVRGASKDAEAPLGEWIRTKKGGVSRLHQTSIENKLARDCRFWVNPYKQRELLQLYKPRLPPSLYYYWDIHKEICSSCRSCQLDGLFTKIPCSFFSNTECTDDPKQSIQADWDDVRSREEEDLDNGRIKYRPDTHKQKIKSEVYGIPVFQNNQDGRTARKKQPLLIPDDDSFGKPKFFETGGPVLQEQNKGGKQRRPIMQIFHMLKSNSSKGPKDDNLPKDIDTSILKGFLDINKPPKTKQNKLPYDKTLHPSNTPFLYPDNQIGEEGEGNGYGQKEQVPGYQNKDHVPRFQHNEQVPGYQHNEQFPGYQMNEQVPGHKQTHYEDIQDHIHDYSGPHRQENDQNYKTPFDESRRIENGYSVYRFSTESPTNILQPTPETVYTVTLDPYDLKYNMTKFSGLPAENMDQTFDPRLDRPHVVDSADYYMNRANQVFTPMSIEPEDCAQDNSRCMTDVPVATQVDTTQQTFIAHKIFIAISLLLILAVMISIGVLLKTKYANSRFKLLDNSDAGTSYGCLSPYQEVIGDNTSIQQGMYDTSRKNSESSYKQIPLPNLTTENLKLKSSDCGLGYGNSLNPLQYGSTSESSLSLLSQDQPYKEMVTINSNSHEQPYKELVILKSRSPSEFDRQQHRRSGGCKNSLGVANMHHTADSRPLSGGSLTPGGGSTYTAGTLTPGGCSTIITTTGSRPGSAFSSRPTSSMASSRRGSQVSPAFGLTIGGISAGSRSSQPDIHTGSSHQTVNNTLNQSFGMTIVDTSYQSGGSLDNTMTSRNRDLNLNLANPTSLGLQHTSPGRSHSIGLQSTSPGRSHSLGLHNTKQGRSPSPGLHIRSPGRSPSPGLHITSPGRSRNKNTELLNQESSPQNNLTGCMLSSSTSSSSMPSSSVPASSMPSSVARSLKNINPSRESLKKIQTSVGQSFNGLKTSCQQTFSYN